MGGGWVPVSISEEPHGLIGTIVTGLVLLQPLMALLRPLPSSPNRKYFNWIHLIVGAHGVLYIVAHLFFMVIKQRSDKGDAKPAPDGADEKGSALRKCIVGAFTVCSVPLAVAAIIIIATA